jgi:hypothetical protein
MPQAVRKVLLAACSGDVETAMVSPDINVLKFQERPDLEGSVNLLIGKGDEQTFHAVDSRHSGGACQGINQGLLDGYCAPSPTWDRGGSRGTSSSSSLGDTQFGESCVLFNDGTGELHTKRPPAMCQPGGFLLTPGPSGEFNGLSRFLDVNCVDE